MSELVGIAYHVDHIVPLQGKGVCGLHVPWNLGASFARLTIFAKAIAKKERQGKIIAKHMGFSANRASLAYVRDNADVMYLISNSATEATALNIIVSAVVSSADFTLASAVQGCVMTIGAKNSQTIEGSGNATHLALQSVSGSRRLLLTAVSAQVLASGNTVNVASWTVTANASANNA